jgi:hypothetical protein
MKLEATIKSVIEEGNELSITIHGWYGPDPVGTARRPLGTINVQSTARNRKAYYIGRLLWIDVRPS